MNHRQPELSGPGAEHLTAVLEGQHGPVAPGVVERIWQETAGNPLAALEITRGLSCEQLAGTAPLPPVLACSTAVQLFAARLSVLSGPAGELLRLLAVGTGLRAEAALAAAGELGLDLEALDELDDAGLIDLTAGRVVLCHPLLRGAVIAKCPARALRAVHAALADVLTGDPTVLARRVWHLAAAARGPSAEVAAMLAELAGAERAASGHAAASAAYERAAQLAPSAEARVGYLIAAAECAHLSGDHTRAGALIDRARPVCRASPQRARLGRVEGSILYHSGYPLAASEALSAAAGLVAEDDRGEACRLYVAAAGALYDAGQEETCVAAAEWLQERDLGPPTGEFRPHFPIFAGLITNKFWPHLVAEDGRRSSPVNVVRPR